ncbi:ABC transporter permease [Enterococcus asini]|uniref:ABC transporter permease n=1 Tax=Enterococcus asini TaxID=57732 RepID=A0AAW8TZK7_9ENTE|nr:ABC transporter permease [Enterococcus asini]MDT2810397.1 ABC transporter permease [Enterococcus asini]
MKRYLFFRILRSILSIFLVTTLTYGVIYSLIPRKTIFQNDVTYGKLKSKPDDLKDYENTAFSKMGYLDYLPSSKLIAEVKKDHPEVTSEDTAANTKIFKEWAKANGYELEQFPVSKGYYAIKELPLTTRVFRFYKNLIQVDHPWKINDPDNKDMKRGYKITNDPLAGWSVVGSGTKYKYQIYFNGEFPFIHQNIFHLNLGTSYPTFAGQPVTQVIGGDQGKADSQEVTFENGKTSKTAMNIYSRQYQMTANLSTREKNMFSDNYTITLNNKQDPSMIGNSMRMGIIAVLISYGVAVPMSMIMSRYKGKWPDKFGVAIVTVLISVPSLAFIYFFRFIGSSAFGLPDLFPTLGAQDIRSYILPTIILGLLSVSGIVIWLRRYMIDQQSADYVKFAKAKGLSAGEISRKHIFKNAAIPLVNGIPSAVIGTIAGATITETVFAAPGMGKMLPDAIKAHNNPIVIGLVFIFTTISIFSILLGDITMTLVDPRIKLSEKGGK